MDAEIDFDLTVTEVPEHTLVTIAGEIDVATTPALEAALADATARELPVLLDLAGVTFMDSTGLAGMLALRPDGTSGRRLVLRRPSPSVRRILELTGVIEVFEIDDGPYSDGSADGS